MKPAPEKPALCRAIEQHGRAWVALTLALAVHVFDEASNDFLGFYNPTVRAVRERLPWLPLPTFTFGVWLAGLTVAVLGLLVLARFAFRGARWMVPVSYVFGVLMLLNGLGHSLGSLAYGRLLPGVYSSPLLLVCSVWLLWAASVKSAAGAAPDAR